MDRVVIGVDPHKRSVTFEARDTREVLRVVGTLPTDRDGYRALLRVARQWPDRIWAIEGASGTGRPVAQRLLADGERVLDVPAKLAAVRPGDQLGCTGRRLAADLLADLTQIEARLKALKAELKQAVLARGSGLMSIHGIGPAGAARILADVGDIARFPDRNHFASWTGTAPIDASSGEQIRHRLSRAGNRRLNHVLYMAAFVQLRHDTDGRAYYRRKLAAGKTPMEAMRCLKRRLSDVVYRQLVTEAARREREVK